MARKIGWQVMILGVLALAGSAWAGQSMPLSPQAMAAAANGAQLYIAFGTARQVGVFDVAQEKVVRMIAVPGEPTSLALSGGGRRLYVSCGDADGRICVVDLRSGEVARQIPVGYGPNALTLDSRRNVLYVCNRFAGDVWAIDLTDGSVGGKVSVGREPIAAALTPDGRWLYVANHLPAGAANAGVVAAEVSVVDTQAMELRTSLKLPNGSTSVRGVAASPDGKYVFVSHILSRYTMPTTQLDRGWMNTNALTVIDAVKHEPIDTVLLDDVDEGAANPWAVACSADSKTVFVTHAGTDEVSVIDVDAMMAKIEAHQAQQSGTGGGGYASYAGDVTSTVPNQLSFLKDIRQRVRLKGKGPRALAVLGSKAYVAEYYTDSFSVVDVGAERVEVAAVALGPRRALTDRRRGEMLFNDAHLCFQKWQSCASCHPDGRVDALNWDLLNDGIGNPKNTKSMLLAHQTPPAMITGARPNAESAVRAGFRHILFAVPKEEDAAAIDRYLSGLKPLPSPHLVDGQLNAAAARGKALFARAQCTSCHTGKLLTDKQRYDVGTGDSLDEGILFDTPSLVEAWRTGPYLYDGRAATLREAVTKYNRNDEHGATSNLSDREIDDLVEYILSQ
ncbi:MAG: c-type cytochrome [Phycisphaerales bacterium]|nr:MAG: c-type cytochrome [Phycisphaerales bacterium]